MAPAGQSASWSNVLCCRICSKLFNSKKLPVNLACGHTVCYNCLKEFHTNSCPLDQVIISLPVEKLPPNLALLSILSEFIDNESETYQELSEEYRHIESVLIELASYLHPVECLFGGSVWSDELSRSIQRKLISLLCYQLMEYKGLQRALKTARSLVERALSELIIYHQDNSNTSAILWSAIRSRGCQFLGPAMQEEVLKLILLILSEGALMSRKTLVLYIVQTLREDYPQVSKTCIGHVIQLLYRASCFNVLKREGESSLMQLKTQFRDYDALRREHDAQIVRVAFEQGLRISPDQWSALLYGDQQHRSHMQSIIDKLQSTQDFERQINDFKVSIEQSSEREVLTPIVEHFERFANFDYLNELPDWTLAVDLFDSLLFIIKTYVKFMRRSSRDEFVSRYARSNICRQRDRSYKSQFSRNFSNLRDITYDHVYSADLQYTYALPKNGFHAPVPQMQSNSLSILVEPTPAEYSVFHTALSQLQMVKLPPLTNSSSVAPLSTTVNNNFTDAEQLSVRNLVSSAQLSTTPIPLAPLIIPAVNYPISSPLLPVAPLIQVAVPGSAGIPTGMTSIFPVSSSPLQITLTSFDYISRR
uniref:RING-type E3 ubiquitin transferase n=1 Tax=Onchocerca volvulus TaxID=6282 RepID=A0A8R1U225_ONCVO